MEPHDHGLARDLATMLRLETSRRSSLRWLLAGAAAVQLGGCGRASGTSVGAGSCPVIPDETAGPFPANGSNRNQLGLANALAMAGIVRRDIRTSIANRAVQAAGVPLAVSLQVVDAADGCKPLAGAAVYLWHCDRYGNYSMYSPGLEGQSFLRGLQEADADGVVHFDTVFPGCYPGRVPHVHFEVYSCLDDARKASGKIKTSQFAFAPGAVNEAYKDPGYASSAGHLKGVRVADDMVFRDGGAAQVASVSGGLAQGFAAQLTLGVIGRSRA